MPDRLVRSSDRAVRIALDGLDDGDVAQLARGLIEARLAPALVRRLHAYTRGHPLYLRTVLAEVPVDTLRDEAFERWPVPRSLQVGIRAQVDRLPRESVELQEAMAVLGTRVPLATAARLAALEDPARALGPALAVGLAQWWPAEPQSPVELVHALQRDAVYDAIGPERRRTLHASAAALVGTAAAWTHRVAAATGADPQLADELEQSGTYEASNGRNALAATRLLWASALSEHRDDRERRLLTACAQSLLTMQPVTAAKLRPQVEDCTPGPLRSCVLGVMDMTAGRFPSGEALLNEAWRSALAEPGADWVAVLAGTFLANIMLRNGRGAETVKIARRTLAIGDLDPATTDFTRAVLATGRLWDRGPRAALRDVAHQLDTLATRGVLRLFLGELASARADLATVARRDRQGAGSKLGSLTLSLMSVVDYLDGDWNGSESATDRALAIAAAQDQRIGDSAARFAAVCVQAGRGQWDAADEHVELLSQLTQALGSPVEIVYSSPAAATPAQARADRPAMLRALEPLLDRATRTEGDGIRLRFKPFWLWQQSVLGEALTGTGQLAVAARALRDLHEGYDAGAVTIPLWVGSRARAAPFTGRHGELAAVATRGCWTGWPRPPGTSASSGPPESSRRPASASRPCTGCFVLCRPASTRSRLRNARRSARRSACSPVRPPTGTSSAWPASRCRPRRRWSSRCCAWSTTCSGWTASRPTRSRSSHAACTPTPSA
ncbi:hypothetical protein [Embleya sp. NPDC059237]|uniref:hypothetical protein n=1 Tax=Embleya sp. NPDC059237 TaxID=3346784 RepID=UPI0036A87C15